jgi:hypothetical protein
MSRISPGRLRIVLTVLIAAPAVAQQTSVDLEPIDQAIEDVSALSMSLREIEAGLGQPNDFSRVFRIHGKQDMYMRQQGGLYAVFPESVYQIDKKGQLRAVVPNDTMFYIGRPAMLDAEPPPVVPTPEGLHQGRIDLRVTPNQKGTDLFSTQGHRWGRNDLSKIDLSPFGGALPAIVADETYRQRRVHGLMRRAAAVIEDHAARGRSSSSK